MAQGDPLAARQSSGRRAEEMRASLESMEGEKVEWRCVVRGGAELKLRLRDGVETVDVPAGVWPAEQGPATGQVR